MSKKKKSNKPKKTVEMNNQVNYAQTEVENVQDFSNEEKSVETVNEKQKVNGNKNDKKKDNKKSPKKVKEKGALKRKAKETMSELKKVIWPSFGEVVKKTGVVLVVVLVFAVVIFGIDYCLGLLVNLLK
jgi:preprotein translocase subunit SecE